ncbi:hypothetical protein HDU85_000129 [Gaertneriomyces sp. JEL0708]|nr:hypothetical protein HDU85_000129 [Gaertneriomyces sp. JEL0708]
MATGLTDQFDNCCSRNWNALVAGQQEGMALFHSKGLTFADMLHLTRLYLLGRISSSMNVIVPLHPETETVISALLQLNACGIVSVSSQPALRMSTVHQRPYLEALVQRQWFERVLRKRLQRSLSSGILCQVKTISTITRGIATVIFSNIEDKGVDPIVPYSVTRKREDLQSSWDDSTYVGPWVADLQEIEQWVKPCAQHPTDIVQCIFTTTEWDGPDMFDELAACLKDTRYPIVMHA